MSTQDHHDEYGKTFVAGLEWMWGEGFLSPGGEEEVARIVAGAPIDGARVLDVGCGLGAVDVLLVERFGAAHVTGIDVEAPLVARATARVDAAGLADRVSIRMVSAGPFPFEDGAFDVVFSKDSMIHIPDKRALYEDIHRVLAPGGRMALSDWFGNGLEPTPAMREWLDVVGLTFRLESIEASGRSGRGVRAHRCRMARPQRLVRAGHRGRTLDPDRRQLPAPGRASGTRGSGAAAGQHDEEEGHRRRRRAASGAPARTQVRLSRVGPA